MTDIVKRMRDAGGGSSEAANEIERLRDQLKTAIWSDSEECKLLTAENKRLRAVLRHYGETFCEFPNDECCGKLEDYDCSGCKARAAIAAQEKM